MNFQQIIKLQQEVIDIYEDTFKIINKTAAMIVKDERDKPLHLQNKELLDFAWSTNDCITDQPRLKEIHEKLKNASPKNVDI